MCNSLCKVSTSEFRNLSVYALVRHVTVTIIKKKHFTVHQSVPKINALLSSPRETKQAQKS